MPEQQTQAQSDQEKVATQTPAAVDALNMQEYVWLRDYHNSNLIRVYKNWMEANTPHPYPFPMPMLVKLEKEPDGTVQVVDDKLYEPPVPPPVVVLSAPDPLGTPIPGLKGIRSVNALICKDWPDQMPFSDARGSFVFNKYATPFGVQMYFREVTP